MEDTARKKVAGRDTVGCRAVRRPGCRTAGQAPDTGPPDFLAPQERGTTGRRDNQYCSNRFEPPTHLSRLGRPRQTQQSKTENQQLLGDKDPLGKDSSRSLFLPWGEAHNVAYTSTCITSREGLHTSMGRTPHQSRRSRPHTIFAPPHSRPTKPLCGGAKVEDKVLGLDSAREL